MERQTANCKLCKQMQVPTDFASSPLCAWDSEGNFDSENWNCETAIALRTAAGEGKEQHSDESFWIRRDDTSYAALFVPPHPEDIPDGELIGPFRGGGFIGMTWYKHRGRTDVIVRIDPRNGGMPKDAGLPLTLVEADQAIENLKLSGAIPETEVASIQQTMPEANVNG